jgi:spore photoproduct lyase
MNGRSAFLSAVKRNGMSVSFKEYPVPRGRRLLVEKVRDGSIIRRFEKTPTPIRDEDVVCPHFLELAWAGGCAFNCSWCYLKGTYRWRRNPSGIVPPSFKNRTLVEKDLRDFIDSGSPPEVLNTGELCDSLMSEKMPEPFSEFIMPKVLGSKHRLLFVTKGVQVEHFLRNEWQRNAILSWSVNADSVAEQWERGAPTVEERLKAAQSVMEAGYEVRLRIDPIVPTVGWEDDYRRLIDQVFDHIWPERITLGTLRGLASTLAMSVDKSWTVYLSENSNWGKKSAFELRRRLYEVMVDSLRNHGFERIGVCKETLKMWRYLRHLGLWSEPMTCNCLP